MRNRHRKIIIDTNLFISFLITRNYTRLNDILFSTEWLLIFGDELIGEMVEVARRPKFRRFFSITDIEDLLTTLYKHGRFVAVKTEVSVCRDPKDNFLLALAVDGQAEFLLTGDQDLLVLEKYDKTIIITIADFIQLR
jgi:putative PIN family toxin of toxin-antitoxin system